ncbi:MAG: GAF domain-containing protein, partial [Anaerolineae bacterium]|nr:GAF domain-containing protein [Anaerolineae bacterium]
IPNIFELTLQTFEAQDASIILVDKNIQVTRLWLSEDSVYSENDVAFIEDVLAHGVAGWVIRNRQALLIPNSQEDDRWLSNSAATSEPWSVICTPFIIRDEAMGAVTVSKQGVEQLDEADLNVLNIFVHQAANILEKALIVNDSRYQLSISELFNEASRSINSSLDLNEVMQSMLVQMNEFLHAEAISIALVDKQSNELVYQVAAGIGSNDIVGLRLPSNRGVSGWVMEHGKPALVHDADQEPRIVKLGDERTGHHTRAMICAPITYKSTVLGTIQAINPIDGQFTESDLSLLVNLANIASSAIANAQQYARTQEAEARYTSLYQDSIDPIILTEVGGRIVDANRRAFAFLGYPHQDLLNKAIQELHPPDALLPNTERMETNSVRVFNSKIIMQNGRQVHVEVYAKRTSYGDSEFVQWIYHDISKQIELEEMRKDLQAMLFHDLQSPLGNVISSLELLTYELPRDSSPALLEMLDIAMRSSSRLQTLIRSLLDINQLEAGHPISEQNRIEVQSLIDDAWETVKPGYEKRGIPLVQVVAENVPDVYVEEDMLRRVLVNLLDNAIKYSPDSHEITIKAVPADNGMVLISVSDQGDGIPAGLRRMIFEKFRRINTDTYSKGLGLGLAFCRLTVEAHGGQIWVDDAPGGGACFNFTIPRWKEDNAA